MTSVASPRTIGAPMTAVQLIFNDLGVEFVEVEQASGAGDGNGGSADSLEILSQLGRDKRRSEAECERADAAKRPTDSLSDAERLAYARKLRIITHRDEPHRKPRKGAKNKDIFLLAAQMTFAQEPGLALAGRASNPIKQPVSWRTVETLWRTYVEAGRDIRVLKPRFGDRGRRQAALDDAGNKAVRTILHERWLTGELSDIHAVWTAVKNEMGDEAPSERTNYREIEKDPVLRAHRRKINNEKQKKLVGLRDPVERPLDEAQIDEAFLDEEVMEATGHSKKGSVLLCTDACTGMPLGLDLGIGAANADRARLLMLHAIEPKPPIMLANGTKVPWAARGLPCVVKGDLGSIFTTDAFVLPLADFNIRVQHTPVAQPWLKGVIERLNGVIKRWLRIKRLRAGKDGKILMSLEDLQRLLELAIAKYILRARRGRGEARSTASTAW